MKNLRDLANVKRPVAAIVALLLLGYGAYHLAQRTNSLDVSSPVTQAEFTCTQEPDKQTSERLNSLYLRSKPFSATSYDTGSYCESPNGWQLVTLAYMYPVETGSAGGKVVALFNNNKLIRSYDGEICHTVGDFVAPRIASIERGKVNMYCLSGDAGFTAFNAFVAPLDTLVPTEAKEGSDAYAAIQKSVEKIYNIDFSELKMF